MNSDKFLICVPTYNEAENIDLFLESVFNNSPAETHILVIDDNSPDGTAHIVEKKQEKYSERLHLLNRPEKQGLAAAYLAAFEWGLSKNYNIFLEMDADFSHNPKYILTMLNEIKVNDVVIGSRNIKDGGVEGWSLQRKFISEGGSLYSRILLGCPIKDLTGGFNMWRKNALEKIRLSKIISKGYSFQVEMKYRAYIAGLSIKEIPIIFSDRTKGKSKMSKKIFFEALVNVIKIKLNAGSNTGLSQFIKFSLTGMLGTITNLTIFFLLADISRLPEVPVSIGCFLIAVTQNYIINHNWSFADAEEKIPLSLLKWAFFLCTSLFGLVVNIIIMMLIISSFSLPFKFIAQAAGIMGGMLINFIFSKLYVWRKKSK